MRMGNLNEKITEKKEKVNKVIKLKAFPLVCERTGTSGRKGASALLLDLLIVSGISY